MMTPPSSSRAARGAADLGLDAALAGTLRGLLPTVAEETVAAVIVEVPGYAGALTGRMGDNISDAVQMALGGFLRLASRSHGSDPGTPLGPALDAAYSLGRGEARSGRSTDALLAAYRVGARVAWREMAGAAAEADMPVGTMAKFAELVFAYIDELSAASVAGHTDELSTSGRARERHLERLSQHLLAGASPEVLEAAAERASWPVPRTLTAVLLPSSHARGLLSVLDPGTLQPREDVPGLEDLEEETMLLLVPDVDDAERQQLLRVLGRRPAVVGPALPWMQARGSHLRALRAQHLALGGEPAPVDTDQHLADLVLGADQQALDDLRRRALAPLARLRPSTAHRLEATLRAWLLRQGRRDAVAADLFVHPQTVRYRMGQLRELFGERLDDPRSVLELTIALNPPSVARDD